MLKQETVELDGSKYLITQFECIKGLKLFKDIAKVALPAFKQYYREGATMLDVFEAVVLSLDDVDLDRFSKELLSNVTKDGMSLNVGMEFAGRYDVLFELCMKVCMFNFETAFSKLGL